MVAALNRRVFGFALYGAAAALALASVASAEEVRPTGAQIFQQRTADGQIVLTDRPVNGAVTQRIWRAPAEDVVAARERREAARLDAVAVTERVQRRIDAELARDHELALARLQVAAAQTQLAAEQERAQADAQPAVIFLRADRYRFRGPGRDRPQPVRPFRPPARPGVGLIGGPAS